jgi:protease-4
MHRPPSGGNSAFGCFFALSLFLNIGLVLVLCVGCLGLFFSGLGGSTDLTSSNVTEKTLSGSGKDKISVLQFDGVILEGTLGYIHKQIEQAAKDSTVKAVVLRINSPGGSITASDDLYRRLTELRDGNTKKKYAAKHLVVSMSSLAASGGYYMALPGEYLFAERTTMTGSIGVYAAFPDINGLAKKYEFGFNTIKAGDIKDSGSMFKKMSDEEWAVWQSMIDQAYIQFTDLVAERRTSLKPKSLTEKFDYKMVVVPGLKLDRQIPPDLKRNIADGGIWTAKEALDHGLIDELGTLDDATTKARQLAALSEDAKIVHYERQKSLGEALLGTEARKPSMAFRGANLSRALTPRLWALMPGADLAGILAGLDE